MTWLSAPASITSRGHTSPPSPAIVWVITIGSATVTPGGTTMRTWAVVPAAADRLRSANTSGDWSAKSSTVSPPTTT